MFHLTPPEPAYGLTLIAAAFVVALILLVALLFLMPLAFPYEQSRTLRDFRKKQIRRRAARERARMFGGK